MTRSELSKLPPRSLVEVTNVLKGPHAGLILASITRLDYKLAEKDDQVGDKEAKRDWGISVVEEEGIPAALKKDMMESVLSVDLVRLVATEERDDHFFHRIFINRMCSTDEARQQRQKDGPQHPWHTDGLSHLQSHLTVVLTLYDSVLDSDLISAHDVGGYVKLSNFDDGRFTPCDLGRRNHPKPSSTTTYYPKTNSLYIFPGYFVAHAVFKVNPGTTRFSVVMFIKLRDTPIGDLSPDKYLRRQWAASNPDGKKEVCERCWSAFATKSDVRKHQSRSRKCINVF
jgi:hypothetical protein